MCVYDGSVSCVSKSESDLLRTMWKYYPLFIERVPLNVHLARTINLRKIGKLPFGGFSFVSPQISAGRETIWDTLVNYYSFMILSLGPDQTSQRECPVCIWPSFFVRAHIFHRPPYLALRVNSVQVSLSEFEWIWVDLTVHMSGFVSELVHIWVDVLEIRSASRSETLYLMA